MGSVRACVQRTACAATLLVGVACSTGGSADTQKPSTTAAQPPSGEATSSGPDSVAFTRASPDWNGQLRLNDDGTVAEAGFDAWLASHPQPSIEEAARRLFSVTEGTADVTREAARATATLLIDVTGDDSVSGVRYTVTFTLAGDVPMGVEQATWAQRCARGADASSFKPRACA